jgi:hypothetical protein
VEDHRKIGCDGCDKSLSDAPFIGESCTIARVLSEITDQRDGFSAGSYDDMISRLTTKIKILLRVAQTRTKTPALSTTVVAIFFKSLRLDFQSIGIGMSMRYGSVREFAAKVTAMTGLEIAGWHTSREAVLAGIENIGAKPLTARIRIDLPVFVEWSACRENCNDACQKAPDDKDKPNIDRNAITPAKAVLRSVSYSLRDVDRQRSSVIIPLIECRMRAWTV